MARILDQAQNTRVDTKTDASAESPCVAVPITPASSPDATSRTDTPSILQPDDQAAPSSISSPAVLPTASPQYQLLGGMITWGNIGKLLLGIPSVAKPLSVLIALTFASLIAYAEFTGQRVVIELFEVPSHLRDSGFTSRTIANKLTDHITSIDRKSVV